MCRGSKSWCFVMLQIKTTQFPFEFINISDVNPKSVDAGASCRLWDFSKAINSRSCLLPVKPVINKSRQNAPTLSRQKMNKVVFYWTSLEKTIHYLLLNNTSKTHDFSFLKLGCVKPILALTIKALFLNEPLPTLQPLHYLQPWLLRFLLHMNRMALLRDIL